MKENITRIQIIKGGIQEAGRFMNSLLSSGLHAIAHPTTYGYVVAWQYDEVIF